jgi:hypothetical protein
MQRAVNPQTGEVLFLVDNQWVLPAQTAKNDKGDTAYLVGNKWEIVPGVPAPVTVPAPAPVPAPVEPAEQPDTYDYTPLAKATKYQSAPTNAKGVAQVTQFDKGDVTPNISNSFKDSKGNTRLRSEGQSNESWIAERRANETEPASTFARPGDIVAPRYRDLSAPAPAPTLATPVAQRPAAQSFLPPPAPKPEPDRSFSPIEEGSKAVASAATIGIPSLVEQFKLAGSAEVLGNTIQQMQLLEKIDKGEIKSPNELPRDPRVRAYFASGPDVRGQIRQSIIKDLTNNKEFVNASLSLLSQYQRENQKYKPRQEKLLEVESAADFGNWLASGMGSGAVYAIPSIVAAITTKQPGLFALGTGMGYSEAVSNRLEAMAAELKSLPPEERAARVTQRLQETDDVNLAVAVFSGALDRVLGPAAKVAKEGIKGFIKSAGKKGALKEAGKEFPKQAGQEFVAGSGQEGAQAAGKVQTGERKKFATVETAKEMFESGAKEAAGSIVPTAGLSAISIARTPSAPKTATEEKEKIEPTFDAGLEKEQEQPAPPVDKRQALKDALAKRMKPAAAEQSAPPTVVSEAAPIKEQATPEQIKEAAAILERRGFDPADALRMATARLGGTPEVTQTNAPIEEGAEDVTKPISEAGGESPALSAQSADNVPATTGVGEAERDGVVLAGTDVTESTEGKGTEPVAVTDEEAYAERTKGDAAAPAYSDTDARIKRIADRYEQAGDKEFASSIRNIPNQRRPSLAETAGLEKAQDQEFADKAREQSLQTKKADAQSTARSNARTAFDQVNDPQYGGSIDAAVDDYRQNVVDTLLEQGLKNDPDFEALRDAAERAFDDEVTKLKGAELGTKTPEAVQTKEEGQEAPAAGAVTGKQRGRPKADITEEKRAEKEKARTEGRADYMKGERALPKLQTDLDKANAPIDETNIADDEGLTNAENEKRAAKRDAINAMLDLEAKHRGTALGTRVKAALADRSKISQKEYDDVVAGRKYKDKERVNKSSASNDEVEAADEGFNKAKNAAQALTRVIKTGTGFQKFLAKRLRSLVAGVNFVVVEETDPLPEQLSRHQEAWGNDNSRARGVYFENTATGERTIFVRGASAGSFQGINNTTVLHEALHAALQQKLELALLAVQRGFSGDAKLVRAYNDLIAVMNNAKDEYNRLANLGELPAEMFYLKTVSGVFSNPHEFVSYGMTDPFFQKFLMGAYGFEEESGFFTRFVDALREMLGMATDTVNALSDLIVVTDKLVSSKLTPTMKMIAKADKANAVREARVGKVYTQTPKMPQPSTVVIQETQAEIDDRVQYHLEQIQRSRDAEEIAKQASLLYALRDPKKILPALNRLWKSMDRKQMKAVLVPLHIDVAASWGSFYVPELANTNVLMQKMAGLTQSLMEGAADISTDAMRVFSKNPGEMKKIQDVALAATLARIDPADKNATKRAPALDKKFNDLTEGGQRVYTEMRDHLNDMTDNYMLLLEDSINAENIPEDGKALIMARIKQIYEASKRITPYFALTREGPYWLSVKKGLGGEREFWMRPSLTERDALEEQFLADGIPKRDIDAGNNIADLRKNTYQKSDLLKDVFAAIENVKDTDPKAKENLKDAVYELYLRTMPENSFRGQFVERDNITGFSTDVLKGFNETSVKMAVQLARLKYGPQLRLSISAARSSAKGRREVEVFIDDMERRVVSALNPRERSGFDTFATIMNRLSAVTYLSGPSTAFIQPLSILQTGAVILGARYGYTETLAELGKMSKFWDEYAITKKRLDGTTAWVMPTIENSKALNLNEEEKWAVKQMRLRAVTSSTYASELFEFNVKSTEEVMSKTEKAKVAAASMTFGLLHSADRIAREVIWIAAYRLNRRKGRSPEESVDRAVIDTNESQGNFSDYAKSALMKAPGGRLAFQFTTFAINIAVLLIRNFYRMIAGLNGEGRLEAFKIFFGVLSSTALLGGITALPAYSIVMALLSFAWEDKERPQELKDLDRDTWFTQVYLPEILGDITVAGYKLGDLSDLVSKGVLNKLTGLDFSSRMSLSNMFFRDIKETQTSREEFLARALERAGPAANMVLNWMDAYDAFAHGDSQKGLEKVAPAILRNIVVAKRYSEEGVKDNKGTEIASKDLFSKWDLYGQAIGFRSAPLANAQAINFKLTAVQKRIENERTGLLNDLDRYHRKNDLDGYKKVEKEVDTFNTMYPTMRIDLSQVAQSLQTRDKARDKSWRGIELDKHNDALISKGMLKSREDLRKREEEVRRIELRGLANK